MDKFYRLWSGLSGNTRGCIFLLASSLVAVAMSSIFKFLGQRIPVIEILFFRQLAVFLFIVPLILKSYKSVFSTTLFHFHFLRSLISSVAMFTAFTAIVHMPLAEATAISFVRTLFTTILAIIILKESVGPRRWASVVIGFIGVLIIVRPDVDNINIYALLAVLSAFLVSCSRIIMRKLSLVDNSSTIIAYQSGIIAALTAVFAYYQWVTPSLEEAFYISVIGGLMFIIQWLTVQAFKAGETSAIAPMEYSRVLYAVIIGIVFFAEIPTIWTILGSAIIIMSTLYTLHRRIMKKKSSPAHVEGDG